MNQFNLMLLVFFAYVLWQATKNHFKPQQMSGLEWADFTLYGPASEEKLSFQNGKLIRSLKFSGIFGHFHPDQIFRSSTMTFIHVEGQSYEGPVGIVTAPGVIEHEKDDHVIAKVFCSDAMFATIKEMNALIRSAPETEGKQIHMNITRSEKIPKANLLLKIWRIIRSGPVDPKEWERPPSPIDYIEWVGAHLLLAIDEVTLEDFSYKAYPWARIKEKTDEMFRADGAKSPERLYLMAILSEHGPRYGS